MSTASESGLTARGLVAGYGKKRILFGVDLDLLPGRSVAVIGPNGAGKSTLLNALAGTLEVSAGEIFLDGKSTKGIPRRAFAKEVAVVPQRLEIGFGLTGRQVVSFGRTPYLGFLGGLAPDDRAAIDRAISSADVSDFVDQPFSTLSGGEAQRVVLAAALAQESRYLLLDEPTVHLDLGQQWRFMELLARLRAERQVGVLAIMHDLNLAGMGFDEVIVLSHGIVVANGPPKDVLTAETIQSAFGAPVSVWSESGSIRVAILDRPPDNSVPSL